MPRGEQGLPSMSVRAKHDTRMNASPNATIISGLTTRSNSWPPVWCEALVEEEPAPESKVLRALAFNRVWPVARR